MKQINSMVFVGYSVVRRSLFSFSLLGMVLVFGVLATGLGIHSVHGMALRWDFNDGTMQGWTNVSVSTAAAGFYDLKFGPIKSAEAPVGPIEELGAYYLGEIPETNNSRSVDWKKWPEAGSGIHQTLWLQSPSFQFTGGGNMLFKARGFSGPANPATGKNDIPLTTIPAIAGTWGAESGSPLETVGNCAVGLRRDDGKFVMTWHVETMKYNEFTDFLVTAHELAPFVKDGHAYTLNVIDNLGGGYSWMAIDEISVPGVPGGYLFYDFDDGTMQGWTNKMTSTAAAGYYDLAFAPIKSTHGWVAGSATEGKYFLGESPEHNDSIHMRWKDWPAKGSGVHQTLWAQSPPFVLTEVAALTFKVFGETGAPNPEKSEYIPDIPLATVPAIAGTWGPESGHPGETAGNCAIGLRRDDGEFVLTRHVADRSQVEVLAFTANELLPYVNDGHSYTLDIVDSLAGETAWIAIGDILIPGKLAVKNPRLNNNTTTTNGGHVAVEIPLPNPNPTNRTKLSQEKLQ